MTKRLRNDGAGKYSYTVYEIGFIIDPKTGKEITGKRRKEIMKNRSEALKTSFRIKEEKS
jgi:hypothetical protein